MGKQDEITKIDQAIKDAESALSSIILRLGLVITEINLLNPIRGQLEENIQFLKRDGTIPIAQEFKKVKQELAKTVNRLGMLNPDREKIEQAITDTQEIIAVYKAKQKELMKDSSNNILTPKFGGKRGKS